MSPFARSSAATKVDETTTPVPGFRPYTGRPFCSAAWPLLNKGIKFQGENIVHLLAKESVRINRPANIVFDYVANMERFGEWFPGVLSIESANGHPHGSVGKEYLETVAIPLRGERKIKLVVREAQASNLFVTEGQLLPLMPRMEISIDSNGTESCNITWRMFSRNESTIFRLTLLPFARRVVRKRATRGLGKLKSNLELE